MTKLSRIHSEHRDAGALHALVNLFVSIDRTFVSPSGFDWKNLRMFLARGDAGRINEFANV